MTERDELKVYCFYWSNTHIGVTDVNGTTHYFPEKRVVIAKNENEARVILEEKDENDKKEMRSQMRGHRPDSEIEELIEKVFYKDGLCVREFPLQKGLNI